MKRNFIVVELIWLLVLTTVCSLCSWIISQQRIKNAIPIDTTVKDNNNDTSISSPIIFYSLATGDRTGGEIHNMLMAHAYGYANNITYGGACHITTTNSNSKKKGTILLSNIFHSQLRPETKRIIQDLHLSPTIQYACPSTTNIGYHNKNITNNTTMILDRKVFRKYDNILMNQEWKNYFLNETKLLLYDNNNNNNTIDNNNIFHIVAHIRRGDVTPCRYYDRYLPNNYYIKLIEQYIPKQQQKQYQVTIYSESKSTESFDIFHQKNYTVLLDTSNLSKIWKHMIHADVLILSKSRFSIVPAIFNNNTVIYTNFWYQPLPGWRIVNDSKLFNETMNEMDILRNVTCTEKDYIRKTNKRPPLFFTTWFNHNNNNKDN